MHFQLTEILQKDEVGKPWGSLDGQSLVSWYLFLPKFLGSKFLRSIYQLLCEQSIRCFALIGLPASVRWNWTSRIERDAHMPARKLELKKDELDRLSKYVPTPRLKYKSASADRRHSDSNPPPDSVAVSIWVIECKRKPSLSWRLCFVCGCGWLRRFLT